MASNASFYSTREDFESLSPALCNTSAVEKEDGSMRDSVQHENEEGETGREDGKEEIRLLRQALESVQIKLLETRKENRSLQAQLKPERSREREEDVREKVREEELMESLAELQAKLTETQERYHRSMEEVEELKAHLQREREGGGAGGETTENEEVQKQTSSTYEQDVRSEEDRQRLKETEERADQLEKLYEEAQVEIRMLQVNTHLLLNGFGGIKL